MTLPYSANTLEQIVFYCIIAIACISELAIRIYADINAHQMLGKSKRADSGSVVIVVIGLIGNILLLPYKLLRTISSFKVVYISI